MFENAMRGREARNFTTKCSENSRSQIVLRTDIFRNLTLGAPVISYQVLAVGVWGTQRMNHNYLNYMANNTAFNTWRKTGLDYIH